MSSDFRVYSGVCFRFHRTSQASYTSSISGGTPPPRATASNSACGDGFASEKSPLPRSARFVERESIYNILLAMRQRVTRGSPWRSRRLDSFRSAVPFSGQTTQFLGSLSQNGTAASLKKRVERVCEIRRTNRKHIFVGYMLLHVALCMLYAVVTPPAYKVASLCGSVGVCNALIQPVTAPTTGTGS